MVTDSPEVQDLLEFLGLRLNATNQSKWNRWNIRPTAEIPISIGRDGQHYGVQATWWLDQRKTLFGYEYDRRYTSFNTRSDKLYRSRRREFGHQRCVVPASCFFEWKGARYKITSVDGALSFGGIYKTWPSQDPLQTQYSCSIITLPPHSRFQHIHGKSFPLILRRADIAAWLDPSFVDFNYWRPILTPRIHSALRVTAVDHLDPSRDIGESEIIPID